MKKAATAHGMRLRDLLLFFCEDQPNIVQSDNVCISGTAADVFDIMNDSALCSYLTSIGAQDGAIKLEFVHNDECE